MSLPLRPARCLSLYRAPRIRSHLRQGIEKVRAASGPAALLGVLAVCAPTQAQVPVLNYSGQVAVRGVPFTGNGYFVFSIEETNGVVWWKSGELPFEGLTALVPNSLKLAVSNGAYETRLGEPLVGMPRLDLALLRRAVSPRLNVWFNDGTNGWHRLSDQPSIGAVLGLESDGDSAPLTRAEAKELLKEVRQLRASPQQRISPIVSAEPPPGPTATISIKDCPSLGNTNAAIVLVEFTDFECPYCKEANETSLAAVRKEYVDSGKLRLVFRNLPLSFHSQAETAARAAYCAAEQGRFWPMHDLLFAISPSLNLTNLFTAAEELQMDRPAFRACIEQKSSLEFVKQQNKEAALAGIRGTPAYILGRQTEGQVTGDLFSGVQPLSFLDKQIQKWLAQ